MSYCLIREGDEFSLIDISTIVGGAPCRGLNVKYKTKKGAVLSGMFLDNGTLTEMKELMKKEKESLTVKRRGRRKKPVTAGFTVHKVNKGTADSEEENEEMMNLDDDEEERGDEGDNQTPRKGSRQRQQRLQISPSPRLVSSGSATPVSTSFPTLNTAPTVSQGGINGEELRLLLEEQLNPLKSCVSQLKRTVKRLEECGQSDTNALESIRSKVRTIDDRDSDVSKKLDSVVANLEKISAALPTESTGFEYKYVTKEAVDLHDMNNNLLVFASRIDELIFPMERHVRLEKRDPVKVKWLFDLLAYRRKISIGPDLTQRMKQVKNRLNDNVWAFNKKQKAPPRRLPIREPPRSQNGRFLSNSQLVHNPNVPPVFVNGQWMIPITAPSPVQSLPSNQYINYTDDSIDPFRHSLTLPPRMQNISSVKEDNDEEEIVAVRDRYPDFDDDIY